MNELSSSILGKEVLPNYQPLAECTGELFGVEYLYTQSGMTFQPISEHDLASEIDEGFSEGVELTEFEAVNIDDVPVAIPPDSNSEDEVSITGAMFDYSQSMSLNRVRNHHLRQRRNLGILLTPGEFRGGIGWTGWQGL